MFCDANFVFAPFARKKKTAAYRCFSLYVVDLGVVEERAQRA